MGEETEAGREEEALLTGSRCRGPEVTTCPRLCDAGGARGGRRRRLANPCLCLRFGPAAAGRPGDPGRRVGAAEAGPGPRCAPRVAGPSLPPGQGRPGPSEARVPAGPAGLCPGGSQPGSCPGAGGSGSPSAPLVPASPGGPPLGFSVFSLFALRWICLRSGEGKSALSPGHFRTSKYNQCPEPGGAEAEIHPGQDQPSHLSALR